MSYWVSKKGYESLVNKRIRVMQEIADTQKRMGESTKIDNDLRENPEYMSLSLKASYELPRKLEEISKVLANCKIFDDSTAYQSTKFENVQIGTKVKLRTENGELVSYIIGGYDESDREKGIVSYLTPIAQALLKKSVGDNVEFRLPKGTQKVQIISIERGYPLE